MTPRRFLTYLREMQRLPGMPLTLAACLAVSVCAALMAGAGLGLVVPLLQKLQTGGAPAGGLSRALEAAFSVAGLPFTTTALFIAVFVLLFGQIAFNYASPVMSVKANNRLLLSLQSRMFENLMAADLRFYHRSRLGATVNTLTNEATRAAYLLQLMIDMGSSLCVFLVYVAVQLLISWKLTAAMFLALGPMVYFLRPRKMYQWGVEHSEGGNELQAATAESLSGIREVKSLRLEGVCRRKFEEGAAVLARISHLTMESYCRFGFMYQGAVLALIGTVIYAGHASMGLSVSELLVFMLIMQRMAPQAQALVEKWHWWLAAYGSFENVQRFLEETSRSGMRTLSGGATFEGLKEGIEVKDVHFRYEGRDKDALDGVSFSIPRGKAVAIVGSSGAGKSTFLDLLFRFYDPARGSLLVDGRDLRELSPVSWRRRLGLVSQDPFLFNDTIENNIRAGLEGPSHDAVRQAARAAHADRFIEELPDGYGTVAGEKGVRLSGGQRQRIALARALLSHPDLLLLDEATSDLDAESEKYIQEALEEFKKRGTLVIVAHRLSTVERCDWIVVMEEGRIVEQGSPGELISRGGRFAALRALQSRGEGS